ncbi:MAG: tetratricopeptide repeat protein [Planctomycetes bacterium]|nr:tetratricopeptide repeat protein [Planctomycetota bacterium]
MQIAVDGLSVSPEYAPLHCNRGVAAYQLGDREQSARHFQTALRFDPDLEQAQAGVKLLQGEQP